MRAFLHIAADSPFATLLKERKLSDAVCMDRQVVCDAKEAVAISSQLRGGIHCAQNVRPCEGGLNFCL